MPSKSILPNWLFADLMTVPVRFTGVAAVDSHRGRMGLGLGPAFRSLLVTWTRERRHAVPLYVVPAADQHDAAYGECCDDPHPA